MKLHGRGFDFRFRRKDGLVSLILCKNGILLCIISESEWKFPRIFDETMDFLKSKAASLLINLSILSQGLLVGFRIKVLALRVVVNKPHHSATPFLRVNNLKPVSDVRLGKSLRGS